LPILSIFTFDASVFLFSERPQTHTHVHKGPIVKPFACILNYFLA
jgi:hypothetical protein